MIDTTKQQDIMRYFIQKSSSLEKYFFGTPISLIPIFKPFIEDDVKDKMTVYRRKQESIGKAIKSTSISGIQIVNWAD